MITRKLRAQKYRKTRRYRDGQQISVCYSTTICNKNILKRRQTIIKPSIISSIYPLFVIMYDPDAIIPEFVHWIAIAKGDNIIHELLSYFPPSPPKNTGLKNANGKFYHRYIFKFYTIFPEKVQIPEKRDNFSIQSFERLHSIKPYKTVFFKVFTD